MLRARIEEVERRIGMAALRAGRRREEITLIAVTKMFPASAVRAAYELGLRAFGENYVLEFEDKRAELEGLAGARYHLIGHLQSNKAARAVELFQVVQTVDSAKLARRLNDAGRVLDIMLEVKLSEEESKHGVDPESVDVVQVPGSFELPLAAKRLAETGRYQAVVCLGCVLRGETPHFDYVAGQAAAGIGRVGLDTGVPVAFGVVTADT